MQLDFVRQSLHSGLYHLSVEGNMNLITEALTQMSLSALFWCTYAEQVALLLTSLQPIGSAVDRWLLHLEQVLYKPQHVYSEYFLIYHFHQPHSLSSPLEGAIMLRGFTIWEFWANNNWRSSGHVSRCHCFAMPLFYIIMQTTFLHSAYEGEKNKLFNFFIKGK